MRTVAAPITLELVDPTGFPAWDERIATHPEATVFHTAAWARVLSGTYGYIPTYFAAIESDRLVGLLPVMEVRSWLTGTRGVSLPFTDDCSPILSDGLVWPEAIRPVLERAEARGWRTLEIRGRRSGMTDLPASEVYLAHVLDLTPGAKTLDARYRPNVRRNIRRSEKAGATVLHDRTPEGMKEFYRLNCLTRREHGLPPQPLRFFEAVREQLLDKGYGTLLLARFNGKAIAGAIFLHFGGKAIYKYGASDRRFQAVRANNLVFREGIRMLCARGNRTLSFGRTDLHHDGLRDFKLSWGAEEKRLEYVCYDVRSGSWLSGRRARCVPVRRMVKFMPLQILRLVGNFAYRHAG